MAKKGKRTERLRDRILVERVGILKGEVPATAKEKTQEGRVIAVGGGKTEKGERVPLDVKVGDRVLFGRYSVAEIEVEDEDYLILGEDEIMGKVSATPELAPTKRSQPETAEPRVDVGGLEEDIEYSNVTKFRSSLLGAVDLLQRNPAKRYVITKLGRPEAVLISYPTYLLLRKLMDQALQASAARSREEAIRDAFARLRQENEQHSPHSSDAPTEPTSEAQRLPRSGRRTAS